MAIHPMQCELIQKIWTIDEKEIVEIINAFHNSENGFLIYNNQIVEKPHVESLLQDINHDVIDNKNKTN